MGLCAESKQLPSTAVSSPGLHILIGSVCCIAYRALEILFYTPWSLYETFYIETVFGFSKANAASFLVERVVMLIQFILLPLPVFILVVKLLEWTGDSFVLACFLLTAIVELVIIWLYPKVIHPLTASKEPFPEKYAALREEMTNICQRVGFNADEIWLEHSYNYDMHGNAALLSNSILIGKPLLK